MYVVPASNPVLEYVVAVEPVFDIKLDQVVPPSVDLSIRYPVIVDPPVFSGALHDRLICDDETVVAVTPVGGCGIVIAVVVADAVLDGELVPTELIAETRYV